MAKKKTTRKKTARTPNRKSKSTRAASGSAKRGKTAGKRTSKRRTTTKKAASKKPSAKKRVSKSKAKTSSQRKKTARKPTKKKTSAKKRAGTTKKKSAARATSKKKVRSASSRTGSGKSTGAARTGPAGAGGDQRKAGMLDPTPAHPNDAMHALNTPARLTRKQLNHFRDLLLKRRAELIGDVQAMESGALRGAGAGDSNHAPMHMADAGTDTYDQEFALQLAATERELLVEIDKSLQRIADGTYGICEVTGKPISLPRLEAKPWAKVCIEVARERDRFHRFRH